MSVSYNKISMYHWHIVTPGNPAQIKKQVFTWKIIYFLIQKNDKKINLHFKKWQG